MDRPRQARICGGCLDGDVLERVVEIVGVQTGNVLDERRLVRLDFAERFEGPDVVFVARLNADVGEIRGIGDNCVEDVTKHCAVEAAAVGFGGAVGPRDVENVGDVCEGGEFGLGLLRVGDVTLDVLHRMVGGPGGARAAGDAVDLPGAAGGVGDGEDFGQGVADDACDADD